MPMDSQVWPTSDEITSCSQTWTVGQGDPSAATIRTQQSILPIFDQQLKGGILRNRWDGVPVRSVPHHSLVNLLYPGSQIIADLVII